MTIVPYRIVKECSIEEAFEDITPIDFEFFLFDVGVVNVDNFFNNLVIKGFNLSIGF